MKIKILAAVVAAALSAPAVADALGGEHDAGAAQAPEAAESVVAPLSAGVADEAKRQKCAGQEAPEYVAVSGDYTVDRELVKVDGGAAILYLGGEWCPWCRSIDGQMTKLSAQYPITWINVPEDRSRRIPVKRFFSRVTGERIKATPSFVWLDVPGDHVDFSDETTFSFIRTYRGGTRGFVRLVADLSARDFPCAPSEGSWCCAPRDGCATSGELGAGCECAGKGEGAVCAAGPVLGAISPQE